MSNRILQNTGSQYLSSAPNKGRISATPDKKQNTGTTLKAKFDTSGFCSSMLLFMSLADLLSFYMVQWNPAMTLPNSPGSNHGLGQKRSLSVVSIISNHTNWCDWQSVPWRCSSIYCGLFLGHNWRNNGKGIHTSDQDAGATALQ